MKNRTFNKQFLQNSKTLTCLDSVRERARACSWVEKEINHESLKQIKPYQLCLFNTLLDLKTGRADVRRSTILPLARTRIPSRRTRRASIAGVSHGGRTGMRRASSDAILESTPGRPTGQNIACSRAHAQHNACAGQENNRLIRGKTTKVKRI